MLVEIAASDQILALSHYSRDPGSSSMDTDVAAKFAYTGGTAEEVLALQPDIVLASSFIAPTTRAALERAGLRVETFGSPASAPESFAQIRELAALTGREAAGEALVERISDSLAQFPSVPPDQSVTAMLWQPGQIVPGEATLVWEHFARFGLVNHAAAMGLGQAGYVSLETVLANPPDLLLIAGDQPGQTHPLLDQLDQTFVARFEPNLFYCGGPSIIRAQERLSEIREAFMTNPPGGITHDAR
jgi:iron complex transport system substrate-binding protein